MVLFPILVTIGNGEKVRGQNGSISILAWFKKYTPPNVWCNKNRTKCVWFDFHCIRRYVYHNEVTSFLKTQSHFFSCIFVSFFGNLVFLYFCNRRLHEYNMTMQVHESRNAPSRKSTSIVYLLVQQNVAQKSF